MQALVEAIALTPFQGNRRFYAHLRSIDDAFLDLDCIKLPL